MMPTTGAPTQMPTAGAPNQMPTAGAPNQMPPAGAPPMAAAPHQKGCKQQKAIGGVGRKALGDIGNVANVRSDKDGQVLNSLQRVVIDHSIQSSVLASDFLLSHRKPPPEIPRPMTRGFCAKLVREGQADTGPEAVPAAPTKLKDVAKVAAQGRVRNLKKDKEVVAVPKPNSKPKSTTPTLKVEVQSSSSAKRNGKKKGPSFTSVLTARSKEACGSKDKPEGVVDIDASDANNQLEGVEFVCDLYEFYKSAETQYRPMTNYMAIQGEINVKMRAILVDWLIEVHERFELKPESLYLTVNIMDRYLSMQLTPRRKLQLVGISAMLIACKYEEVWSPEVNDFICISDLAYNRGEILKMEKDILNRLEWYITVPTLYVFLVRYLKASLSDKEMEHMVFFFAELSLLHFPTSVDYKPSMVAAAAVYAARCTLEKSPLWSRTLLHHTGYSATQLRECAALLANLHCNLVTSKLKMVGNRYRTPLRGAVALRAPSKDLLVA